MTTEATPVAAPVAPVTPMLQDPMTGLATAVFPGDDVTQTLDSSPSDRGDDFAGDGIATPEPVKEARPRNADGTFAAAEPVAAAIEPVAAVVEPVAEPVAAVKTGGPPETIPYARFKEINDKNKALEARMAALEAGAKPAAVEPAKPPAPVKYDFAKAEQEYLELAAEGRMADAVTLRSTINAETRKEILAEVMPEIARTTTATITQRTTQEAIDALEVQYTAQYPALNEKLEGFRQDVVDDITSFYAGYIQRQMAPAAAFEKALRSAVKLHDLPMAAAAAAPVVAPVVPAVAPTIAAKLAAAAAQPPSVAAAGVGASSAQAGLSNIDVQNLTTVEMDALPPALLARLRGDVLE